ncbi:hypothetical protein HAX54_003393 [Datura stramonium]|uniref:Uncharacterized protein n=1 Tax=Datura stramonium TaxID=4076 RepID=A0ABS8T594_DATST|nr:hypothetical protein [Datura stramonium]
METMIILQNQNFLAQLVMEGMKLSMDNFGNHMWMTNVLESLAPRVSPALFHSMKTLWNLPRHFNPHPHIPNTPQVPFCTLHKTINTNLLTLETTASPPWSPDNDAKSNSHGYTSTTQRTGRQRRINHGKGLIYRNIKPHKCSPYGLPRKKGQKIHSQLSNNTCEMFIRPRASCEHYTCEICSSDDSNPKAEPSTYQGYSSIDEPLNDSQPNDSIN